MAVRPSLSLLRSKAWVGGSWISAVNRATFPVYNPSTGAMVAEVADVGEEETDAAIREAHRAQRHWAGRVARVR